MEGACYPWPKHTAYIRAPLGPSRSCFPFPYRPVGLGPLASRLQRMLLVLSLVQRRVHGVHAAVAVAAATFAQDAPLAAPRSRRSVSCFCRLTAQTAMHRTTHSHSQPPPLLALPLEGRKNPNPCSCPNGTN